MIDASVAVNRAIMTTEKQLDVTIHIGMHAAFPGFRRAQLSLYKNRSHKILLNNAICFPSSWDADHFFQLGLISRMKHPLLEGEIMARQMDARSIATHTDKVRNGLLQQLKTFSGEKVKLFFTGTYLSLISADDVVKLRSRLDELFSGWQVNYRIVLLLAHPAELLQELYHDFILRGYSQQQAEELIALLKPYQFKQIIENYTKVFGHNNINVFSIDMACSHSLGIEGFVYELFDMSIKQMTCLGVVASLKPKKTRQGLIDLVKYINNKASVDTGDTFSVPRHLLVGFNPLIKMMRGDEARVSEKKHQEYYNEAKESLAWLRQNYHIDYSMPSTTSAVGQQNDTTSDILNCLKKVFDKLSPFVRKCAIDYLVEQSTYVLKKSGLKKYLLLLRHIAQLININKRLNKQKKLGARVG